MKPLEVGPAITRLQMLAASAESQEEIERISDALDAFDDPASQRELIRSLCSAVFEKMPNGGALVVRDRDDFLALGLIQALGALGRRDFRELVEEIPEPLLPHFEASLLVFWNAACEQAAAVVEASTRIPDRLPKRAR